MLNLNWLRTCRVIQRSIWKIVFDRVSKETPSPLISSVVGVHSMFRFPPSHVLHIPLKYFTMVENNKVHFHIIRKFSSHHHVRIIPFGRKLQILMMNNERRRRKKKLFFYYYFLSREIISPLSDIHTLYRTRR